MARNNEQPPGSLRLARRQATAANTTKPVAPIKRMNNYSLSIDYYSFLFYF